MHVHVSNALVHVHVSNAPLCMCRPCACMCTSEAPLCMHVHVSNALVHAYQYRHVALTVRIERKNHSSELR
jgi:hypothetical protein